MEVNSTKGVLSYLSVMEKQKRVRTAHPPHLHRLEELKSSVEALVLRRDQLKAEVDAKKTATAAFEQDSVNKDCPPEGENETDSLLACLTARHKQLKELLHAHHLIGGFDIIKTRSGKGVCVSLATSYEGVYLDTYNLEIDLTATLKITRHNIPPFIPLCSLAEQTNMQTDIKTFLGTLSQHVNAFVGRKQQLKLVKELHSSVKVMESNVLCSLLVLLVTVPREKTAVLCTLDYRDHTRCLPTNVNIESEDKELPGSSLWKKSQALLMKSPAHKALTLMRTTGVIQ